MITDFRYINVFRYFCPINSGHNKICSDKRTYFKRPENTNSYSRCSRLLPRTSEEDSLVMACIFLRTIDVKLFRLATSKEIEKIRLIIVLMDVTIDQIMPNESFYPYQINKSIYHLKVILLSIVHGPSMLAIWKFRLVLYNQSNFYRSLGNI